MELLNGSCLHGEHSGEVVHLVSVNQLESGVGRGIFFYYLALFLHFI